MATHVEQIVLRTFLVEPDDLRIVLQLERIATEQKVETEPIVPVELVGVKEVRQPVQRTVMPIVACDTQVQSFDAQPYTLMVHRQPRISDQI